MRPCSVPHLVFLTLFTPTWSCADFIKYCLIMFNTNRKSSLLVLLLFCCVAPGSGLLAQSSDFVNIQPKLNSPLSRFGLGNPVDQFFAAQAGLGGVTTTYQDAFHLNLQNPATLASLQATSFEVGGYGRNASLSDASGSANTWQGNLRYLALGFPLRNPISLYQDRLQNVWNGGMAFSLQPTTNVGYDLALQDTDPDFGTTSNVLRGNGSTYRFTWSTAFRYKYLSAGVNVNYNFGKLTNSRLVIFDDLPEALASELLEDIAIGGFSFGYGLQYVYNFKKLNNDGEAVPNGKRIVLGAQGNLGAEVDTDASTLFRRFSPSLGLIVRDTLVSETGREGLLELPASYTFGIAYEEVNRLYVGLEYGSTQNSAYRNTLQPYEMMDTRRIGFGIQYIPDANSYNRFAKRIRYRAGLRLEQDGRSVEGVQARRNAATIGVGLPFRLPRNQISFVDLALEFGKFGVPDILDENYVQFTVGFSLNDNSWFYKRKLN